MTKNEILKKIKKYSDLYKKNRVDFEEYLKIIKNSMVELNDLSKYTTSK